MGVTNPMVGTRDIDFTKVNALAVEDDAGGMAIIGVMMRYLGMNAYINTTGQNVVELARAMKPVPDVIFLDINLPRTTGYEVLKKIRADEKLNKVLVVAVTAQDADTEIPKCMEAGFDGFIGKPISRSRFPRQIRRILSGEPVWETY
jgi:two-component system cell cycle response regulator DivK